MTDASAPSSLADRVTRILDAQGVVDGHDDLAWALRERAVRAGGPSASVGDDVLARLATEDAVPGLHTDLPRRARGRVAAQLWSAWMPDLPGIDPVRSTIEQVDVVRRLVAAHPDRLALAVTADDVDRVAARHGGRALDRRIPRRAPHDARARDPLHDAHPQRERDLG